MTNIKDVTIAKALFQFEQLLGIFLNNAREMAHSMHKHLFPDKGMHTREKQINVGAWLLNEMHKWSTPLSSKYGILICIVLERANAFEYT
jgi:hypothetical protein